MDVARKKDATMAKREGTKRQQLARSFQICGEERKRGSRRWRRKRRRLRGCTIPSYAS
jgi:hypothetical protein